MGIGLTNDELRSARNALGMTQTRFMARLGIRSIRTIQRMESGERPISVRTAMAVKGLLDENSSRQ